MCKVHDKYQVEIAEYSKQWPNHCRECGGTGEHVFIDNGAPHGGGNWPMQVNDICESCTGKEKCPRCGGEFSIEQWDEQRPCIICGWNWGENESDYAPQEPDGNCWECWEKGNCEERVL